MDDQGVATADRQVTTSKEHERVVVERGARTGLPVIVAIHSTALGPSLGGCRMWSYPSEDKALEDALRLSEAMTWKCAVADLPFGGGKSVIALQPGQLLDPAERRDVMLDLGDVVEMLGGRYGVGEDVGTTAADMWVARGRTRWAYGLPPEHGGIGEPALPTAEGVLTAIAVTCRRRFGTPDVSSRRFTIIGLGQVGTRIARSLAAEGAELVVTDTDAEKRSLADELRATWVDPGEALQVETDVMVPAALGGFLSSSTVADLKCAAIVGPANNQLSDTGTAALLAAQGILWAPDFVVNAGGVIYGCRVEIEGWAPDAAMGEVARIGERLERIFARADADSTTPYDAALRMARNRVELAMERRA